MVSLCWVTLVIQREVLSSTRSFAQEKHEFCINKFNQGTFTHTHTKKKRKNLQYVYEGKQWFSLHHHDSQMLFQDETQHQL